MIERVVNETWERVKKFDKRALALADRHYSRRKVGSPQFMPPGQTIVLWQPGAVFGWWRPDPSSGIRAMNGLDGWTCSIFRNEAAIRPSSQLILEAEAALVDAGLGCGPDGLLTYVWVAKVKPKRDPGYCYRVAGWRVHPTRPWSADRRKLLLTKPYSEAGRPPAGERAA